LAHTEVRKSRVLVAAAGLFLCLLTLWARLVWLQIVCHERFEARAERNQEQRVLLPPVRGELLDRHGRPLARDLVTCAISAAPGEMKDKRATARELGRMLGKDPRVLERAFARRSRFLWVARQVPPDVGERVTALGEAGVYVSHETRREYALGPASGEILGRTDLDNYGLEGLELQLDSDLRGRPGWATRFRDGRGQSHTLPRGLKREPEHGDDVVLTVDADLQAIVETHLARAVDTLDAVRGFAVFLDPRTGEILASVSVPHVGPGKAASWTITDTYEPGSTYKVVVTGAALEEGVARPDQVFEASPTGEALVAPGARFHDVHKEERYTLRDAVRWSSNIVMGRLALQVGDERLYRYSTALGFGSLTGVRFPGESAGRLRSPSHWSARSCPTVAIGHELSVTALQLALAYGAIANGGVLMEPMLVRETRGAEGGVRHTVAPRAQRRVFGDATTRILREMLTAVVDSGTARAARVPGLAIAGKTGTAQKYDAAAGTYGKGMYLSSFAGFVPANDPCLVGVIVIDEPRGKHYYGGEIAAPVFREVVSDLRRLPHSPLDPGLSQVASRPPAPAPVTVPDLMLLPPAAAEKRLLGLGLRVRLEGEGERVLAQSPGAGEAVERGASVTAWLEAPADSAGGALPDLQGLPVREALRRLTLCQLPARIEGRGIVVRQSPEPGARLPLKGPVRLWCEPRLTKPEAPPAGPLAAAGRPSGEP
jgi:stage V sporulation protein D (sporulation-specific penicillin-binding protein)